MSIRETLIDKIDRMPDNKIALVVAYVDGLTDGITSATNDIFTDETIAAINEIDSGHGMPFDNAEALFNNLGI